MSVAYSTVGYNKFGYGIFYIYGWENNGGYLFLLLLAVSHATCFLKPSKVLNVKISSASLVYAHYTSCV
jgi:hypothetical protein